MQELTPQQRMVIAEQEFEKASIDAAAQTRGERVKQLKEVTHELEEKQIQLAEVEVQIKQTNDLLLTFNRRILTAQQALGGSLSRRPASARWLTASESAEIALWGKEHKQYEETLAEIIRQRDALPAIDRVAAVQLAERVNYLRQAKLNIMNSLDGSINKLEGGIFSVS